MFTEYDKTIIVSIMRMIMEADSIIHPLEEEYLNVVLKKIGADEDFLSRHSPVDLQSCIMSVKEMDYEKKNFVCHLMQGMSEADGYVDPREIELINKIIS